MPGSASGAILDVLTRPGTPEEIKTQRKFTAPQLREPMLIRGDVDAIMVFDVSSVMTLIDLGVPRNDISLLMYSDIGFDVYGTGLWVSRSSREEPQNGGCDGAGSQRGHQDAIANPRAAALMMKKFNPLLDPNIECERLVMAVNHNLIGDIRKSGLSDVNPKRMQSSIDQVVTAMKFTRSPPLAEVWTDKFLPPQAERIPPALGTCAAK